MIVYDSKYKQIKFDEDNSIIIEIYKDATADMSEEEFKSEMFELLKVMNQYLPDGIVTVQTNLKYAVVPTLQIWINTTIFSEIQKIVRKVALVPPTDYIVSLGVEQTIEEEEEEGTKLNSRFFATLEEAVLWLKKK